MSEGDLRFFAILGLLTVPVLLAVYAGQISDWLNRSCDRRGQGNKEDE
ncbi:hypothetical protein [Pollutimonas nitritireducens]|nr:hypothetical protein [Pollutimonas nitritireducens]